MLCLARQQADMFAAYVLLVPHMLLVQQFVKRLARYMCVCFHTLTIRTTVSTLSNAESLVVP